MAFDIVDKFRDRLGMLDDRDYIYEKTNIPLRDVVDLREWASLVESQKRLGSCTGNAVANAYELMVRKEKPTEFVELSRLFIYYNARMEEGTLDVDGGATIRGSLKGVEKYGICKEALWPYDIEMFNNKPPVSCYEEAKKRSINNYQRLVTIADMLDALNNNKPIVFGTYVYNGFMTLNTFDSTVYLPLYSTAPLGVHAMCVEGYDLPKQLFLVKNSFGKNWGDNGYCYIPFEYMTKESFDRWIFDIEDKSHLLID